MSEKTKKIILFGTIIFISICGTFYHMYLDGLEQVYTIGEITEVYKPPKGGSRVAYTYRINGDIYEGSVKNYGYEDVALPGEKFLVEIPVGFMQRGVMLLDFRVNETLKAPTEGWSQKPKLSIQNNF